MDKIFYLMKEGIKNVYRHKMTTLIAIFSLFISLYIIGMLSIAGENTHQILQYFRSKYKIEVFFNQDVTNEEAVGLIHQIKNIKGIRTATIIEKEDAVRIFQDQFGEDITEILGYNPLPKSAVVNLMRTSKDPVRVEPIIKEIRKINRVDEVRYQGNLIKKIEGNYKRVIDRFPYLAGAIVFIAVLIIYSTIKLSVYSRRELITSLEMIGATRIFIRMPFIVEGLFIGFLSSILVFPALLGSIKVMNYIFENYTSWQIVLSFNPLVWIWLFILILFITLFGSYRAASSFLK